MKKLAILAILFIGVLVLPVEAHHKPGHDKGGNPKAQPVLTVDTATVGQPFDINGTGFVSDSRVWVGIKFFCCLEPVAVDGAGGFTFTHAGIADPGEFVAVGGFFKKNSRFVVIESDPFEVVP